MDTMKKLVELLRSAYGTSFNAPYLSEHELEPLALHLISNGVTIQDRARPLEEWGEDYGDVLWWKFPIEEPPYVGSPLDEQWPAYHTHWTPIVAPKR